MQMGEFLEWVPLALPHEGVASLHATFCLHSMQLGAQGGPQAGSLRFAKREGPPELNSTALATVSWGPTCEISRPCTAKRSPGEGAPGRLQARSLYLAMRKTNCVVGS